MFVSVFNQGEGCVSRDALLRVTGLCSMAHLRVCRTRAALHEEAHSPLIACGLRGCGGSGGILAVAGLERREVHCRVVAEEG